MPWKEATPMSLRREFVALAKGHGISVTELARRFGISRKTAYKWLRREAASEPLSDRSRRPRCSPTQTAEACERAIVVLRQQHPCWGGRKLHRVLLNQGHDDVPASEQARSSRASALLQWHASSCATSEVRCLPSQA